MKYLFFLSVLCISFHQTFSQEENERPKIGLVLSGGGAKGLAHIGIIRALEKAGLTPDYVTGTSMGSIVGGLYAIGYTADEIEYMAKTIDWNAILSNKISLDEITYEEKEYYGRYIVELSIDGVKVGLPKGLIEGQKLSELLSRLTRSVHDIEDFNNLPIPFACVACDIETGEPVLLNKGSLSKAIRASMSIPTIFSPVDLDGHLLVDGGLVRNFPVEEVIAMGADIVIGVFVSSDLEKKEDLDNLLSVLAQSAFVMSAFDSRKQKELVDIYIEPNLKEYSTGSFNQWENIIAIGDTVGESYVELFKNLADSVSKFGPLKTVKPYPKKDEYLVTDITVVGNEKISSEIIIGKLRIQEGSVLSIDEIEKQISIVYGTRFFDKVEYEIIRNGPKYELVIKVVEAPDGYLKLAVHYDSENDIGINGNVTYRNILLPNSRALLEFDLSKKLRLDINYLKYIGKKQNAGLQIGMHYKKNDLPLYEDRIKISTFDANYTDLYLGIQSTSFQNFTFGGRVQVEYSKLTPNVGEVGRVIEKIKNRDISATLFAEYNSFDRPFFPRRGSSFSVSVKDAFDVRNKLTEISEDSTSTTSTTIDQNLDPFLAIELHYTHIFPVVKRFSIITRNSMVLTTLGTPNYNIIDYYFVGGFNPIFRNVSEYWGAEEKEYITPNYFYTKLILQYEPFNNVFFSGIVNYVDVQYPMELFYAIEADDYLGGEKRRLGYGLSVGYNSPFGPLSFFMAWDAKLSKTRGNISLGFWFK